MEDQYGMADLRQYIGGRPNFFPPEAAAPPPDLLSSHRGLSQPLPYDMLLFRSDSTTGAAQSVATNVAGGAASSSGGGCFGGFDNGLNSGGDGGAGRWPRQETLTLLEIRSRLDPKFKEANQKGPLWDEVSRIMCEEHGYQRSGKKCREKFENLYKYYKKTKEGKAGRQDGKHYRFFRQLEALYGENNNSSSVSISEAHHHHDTNFHYNSFPNKDASLLIQRPKLSDNTSLSLTNYSEDNTTSSDDNDDEANKNKKMRWKLKIKEFIDLQMKKVMDKQEAWMEKMMTTIEQKEHERMLREEEWRKQDSARIEREHRFWASERAWIEARDAALMEALRKLTGKELMAVADIRGESKDEMWPENEITRLIQLKAATDGKFDGLSENIYWEEIANKMGCLGHERSAVVCKDKWESVNNYAIKCNSKKRKENTKICNNFYDQIFTAHQSDVSNQNGSGVYCGDGDAQGAHEPVMRLCDQNQSSPNNNNSSSSNNNNNNNISESCFRYFMGDGYGRIMD